MITFLLWCDYERMSVARAAKRRPSCVVYSSQLCRRQSNWNGHHHHAPVDRKTLTDRCTLQYPARRWRRLRKSHIASRDTCLLTNVTFRLTTLPNTSYSLQLTFSNAQINQICSESSNSAKVIPLCQTAAAYLERSAAAPPVESKYIVESRICVMLMTVEKQS